MAILLISPLATAQNVTQPYNLNPFPVSHPSTVCIPIQLFSLPPITSISLSIPVTIQHIKMGSKPIRATANSASRIRRRSNSNRNFAAGKKNALYCTIASAGSVQEKLEALKDLLPNSTQNQLLSTVGNRKHGGATRGEVAAMAENDLFRRTADYIVVLRTQAFVLQKLIDFYSSQKVHDQNVISSSSRAADST